MFEKFTTVDAHDFRQRYQGTYGFFRRGDFRQLAKLRTIDGVVKFCDKDGIEYTLNPDSPNDVGFEFLPPKAGWHNTASGAWLVTRLAARQWLRGICSRNTSIGTPHGHRALVDFPILADIYAHDTKFEDALKSFNQYSAKSGSTGCLALTNQLALSCYKDFSYIFCLDVNIGSWKLVDGVYKVQLKDPLLWVTEVKDAFARNNLKVEVAL